MKTEQGTIFVASDGTRYASRQGAAFQDLEQNLETWRKVNPGEMGCTGWVFANIVCKQGVREAIAQYIADTTEDGA